MTEVRLGDAYWEFKQLRNDDAIFAKSYSDDHFLQWMDENEMQIEAIQYHRNPTKGEIKFGEGAIHYKDFGDDVCLKPNGRIKKWLVCPFDGLRYFH